MLFSRDAADDDHLDRSLQVVSTQAALMRKTLESPQGKLLVAVKQVTAMLNELMTSKLPPRSYYELYNACFDALSQLQSYLIEDHRTHHLADVYTIVQYVSNVLPRLYLMITVGTAFLASGDAPKTEVLKDLLEMSRGVQNPLRGLFLRYYLGQRTGEYLINSHLDTSFCVQFTLTNFIEMNKLWVRYQHQGHSRDYDRRLKERTQLQTIVGSSILRLSQLDAIDIRTFYSQILPAVLDQIVQCRDKLAQEYLLDIIVQVFPAEFHLETLEVFLESMNFLNPETEVSVVLLASMNRILSYARAKKLDIETSQVVQAANGLKLSEPTERRDEQPSAAVAQEEEATGSAQASLGNEEADNASTPPIEAHADAPNRKEADDDSKVDASSAPNDRTTDGSIEAAAEDDASSGKTPKSVVESSASDEKRQASKSSEDAQEAKTGQSNASEKVDAAEEHEKSADENAARKSKDSPSGTKEDAESSGSPNQAEKNPETGSSAASKSGDDSANESVVLSDILRDAASLYWMKMRTLNLNTGQRACLVRALIDLLQVNNLKLPLSELFNFVVGESIEKNEEVEKLLFFLFDSGQELSDIIGLLKEYPGLLSYQSRRTRHGVAEKVISQLLATSDLMSDHGQTRQVLELFTTLLRSGGFDASKLAQFVRLLRGEDVAATLELLQLAHHTMREGGQAVVQKTSCVIANAALLLLREEPAASDVAHILKFVNRVSHDLATVGSSPFAAYRLYVSCGQAADYSGAEEAAYELFAQALTTYEESIMESHQQIVALAVGIQALQHTSVFTSENYDPLAQRCIQYAQRLLKKPDQCRALLLATHLYWDNEYSDTRRVEEVLQRALRSADSVMDILTSIELFLDVLDTYLYYLANDTSTITVGSTNSLLKLIKENIATARKEGYASSPQTSPTDAKVVPLHELEARLSRTEAFVSGQSGSFSRFEGLDF